MSTDRVCDVLAVKCNVSLKGSIMGAHGTPMFHGLGSFMYTGAVCSCAALVPGLMRWYLFAAVIAYQRFCCSRFQTCFAPDHSHSGRRLAMHFEHRVRFLMECSLVHRGMYTRLCPLTLCMLKILSL